MDYGTTRDAIWCDGVIPRRARKRWPCAGNGARRAQHAEGCTGWIGPGESCIEYVAETASYQTGTHHSMPCAVAYFRQATGQEG